MSIKLRAWDNFNAEMIYSDKFDDLYGFFYDVKRAEYRRDKAQIMLASNQFDCEGVQIFEGDIIKFWHSDKEKTGIVECRPEHFCYWQVRILGDHFGLGWVLNCCPGVRVTGNRYADREWLEDMGLGGLLDEAEPEMERIEREHKAEIRDIEYKVISEEAEKFRAFSTEKWAREYSKNRIDPNVKNALINAQSTINAQATPDPEKEEIFAGEPAVIRRHIDGGTSTLKTYYQADDCEPPSIKAATLNQNTLAVDSEQADELMKIFGFKRGDFKKAPTQKPICIGSEYQDGFGHTIKEADILSFKLCGRQFTGEVKRIWSDDRYYWQVWTYESPKLKLSLRHMCEDVACTEVRVIGHISTVRQGGVAVQDIGIQL